jgi:CRISPR-associated protein Cpf1
MMIKHNAIVVLEDLNFGFIRGRQKVEKQVYQKLEKMLIDKLNYLVDKQSAVTDAGGLMNAYQLTNKFENFQKIGKQNGFLFYMPAWHTGIMDPVTGFVNFFDTRYENIEKAKVFFAKFDHIRYNKTKNYFEFAVDDYTQFNIKTEDTRLDWTICTYGDRINTFRNPEKNDHWDSKEINLSDEFKAFFEAQNIAFKNGEDLKDVITSKSDKAFFGKLLALFGLALQMRNSVTKHSDLWKTMKGELSDEKFKAKTDYLISPVTDAHGNFFDSSRRRTGLPVDAGANGAYNIARKGLWAIEQNKKSDNLKRVNFAISTKEWLQFIQRDRAT